MPVHLAIFVVLHLLMVSSALLAEETSCTIEFPAIVTLPDAALIQRLASDGFVARDKSGPTRIESVSSERGPRHILFVIETGKQVPSSARKIEAEILSDVLKNARPEDAFGIMTARGPSRAVRFGASKEKLASTIEEIGVGVSGKNQDAGVLDTIFEGVDWFQPHKAGDAIFVLTMGIESYHRVGFAKVRDSLVNAHIRLFGLQLGKIIGGYYQTGISTGPAGQAVPTAWTNPNLENLFALSKYTGGLVALENAEGDPWKQYRLTDERLRVVRDIAQQEYKGIVEFYQVQIQGSPKDLVLDLSDSIRRQLPQAHVSYPRNFQNCSEVSSLVGH